MFTAISNSNNHQASKGSKAHMPSATQDTQSWDSSREGSPQPAGGAGPSNKLRRFDTGVRDAVDQVANMAVHHIQQEGTNKKVLGAIGDIDTKMFRGIAKHLLLKIVHKGSFLEQFTNKDGVVEISIKNFRPAPISDPLKLESFTNKKGFFLTNAVFFLLGQILLEYLDVINISGSSIVLLEVASIADLNTMVKAFATKYSIATSPPQIVENHILSKTQQTLTYPAIGSLLAWFIKGIFTKVNKKMVPIDQCWSVGELKALRDYYDAVAEIKKMRKSKVSGEKVPGAKRQRTAWMPKCRTLEAENASLMAENASLKAENDSLKAMNAALKAAQSAAPKPAAQSAAPIPAVPKKVPAAPRAAPRAAPKRKEPEPEEEESEDEESEEEESEEEPESESESEDEDEDEDDK